MKILNYKLIVLAVAVVVLTGVFFIDRPQDDSIERISVQAVLASGNTIEFIWADNNDDTKYYRLHHGVNSGQYGEAIETIDDSSSILVNITSFGLVNHYFAVSAVDHSGNESTKSTELVIDLDPYADVCGNGIVDVSGVAYVNFVTKDPVTGGWDTASAVIDPNYHQQLSVFKVAVIDDGNQAQLFNDNNLIGVASFSNSTVIFDDYFTLTVSGSNYDESSAWIVEVQPETEDEICDSNTRLCAGIGNYQGEEMCNSACDDWSGICIPLEYCGDGAVNGNEDCEGSATNVACTNGIYYGTAGCNSCQLSGCNIGAQACGNSILEGGEQCRDNAQYTKSCLWNNVYVGSRGCDNASCLWDTDCVKDEVCQDGYKDVGEDCDMNDFGTISTSCSEWGSYSSGLVECTSNCTANLSNCSLCGNGVIEGDETCDGSYYINNKDDCSDWGFNFGNLNCNDCQIDYSDCQIISS